MMKKICIFLTLAILICMLAACGKTILPDTPASSSSQTDILYADFGAGNVKEYPIEYTGTPKTAEELAHELSQLTGLDFIITASRAEEGWIIDWSADSTLIAGLDGREQKQEFSFFDYDSMSWFMMDSLWRTLTANLDAENIYYTMDGGQELVLEKMSPAITFPADTPYMGSEFYQPHSDVRGDEENLYVRTKGLWRLDGETDTASIKIDGFGKVTMYYASGSVEATGYLEYTSDSQYELYTDEEKWIGSIYVESNTHFRIENNHVSSVYMRDMKTAYQGCWRYPAEMDGMILEISGEEWKLYEADELTPSSWGPVEYDEEACYLMNEDGSSGGGRAYFDEDGNMVEYNYVLTYICDVLPNTNS